VKERWSRSGPSKQKRSFSPRLERRRQSAHEGRVHSRTTSSNTESTLKSAALSSMTTLRPSPQIYPELQGSPFTPSLFAPTPPRRRPKSMILPSIPYHGDSIHITPRRNKSALDLKATSSPFSYAANPSPLTQTNFQHPSSQPLPDTLPRPRNTTPKPQRLVTPHDRDLARLALQEEPDPIDLCIADNIEYDLAHGLLTPSSFPPSPLQLVYNVRSNTFHRERRDKLLKKGEEGEVLVLEGSNPPLLVDGRRIILEIPRWSRGMEIFWRVIDGQGVIRRKRARVVFPFGVWWERNFGKRKDGGMELFVEK
jgi:hypothetical protein